MTKLIVAIIVIAVVVGGLAYLLLRGRGTARTAAGRSVPNRSNRTARNTEFHDLDDCIGTWREDPVVDRALREQDRVDGELWR